LFYGKTKETFIDPKESIKKHHCKEKIRNSPRLHKELYITRRPRKEKE